MSELIYVYGFVLYDHAGEEENEIPDLYDEYSLTFLHGGNVAAVYSVVASEDFGEESFQTNVQNLEWLERFAKRHHHILNRLHQKYQILPLNFGTIYKGIDRLKQKLKDEHNRLYEAVQLIQGKDEWSVKVYADMETIASQPTFTTPLIEEKQQEIENMPRGRQYIEKKRLNKTIAEEAERYVNGAADQMHEALKQISIETDAREVWSKQVTGRTDEMKWNGGYLISRADRNIFVETVQAYEKEFPSAIVVEVSGPWPAYHFVPKQGQEDTNGA
ncbi:gas vesicle protein GvpL/GvpF [Salsuginibacillus halophilus]|uniref:Gas vesicle protein GvpL/GvpF n=1 Tax=Salsuginibacillus halophilus TaxID=517424 RepID=A0A2P8HLI8_9BACI|nr:GvpL/GvpF family gas vesicle protein [Salsuginibacillus halophilus]PSL47084.1 gas vesicle protein GvpL/GvpF [Salsuginibacillus halophilus]